MQKQAIFGTYLCLLASMVLVGCNTSSSAPTRSEPQVLRLPAYHFTLTISAGWTIVQRHEDPTADSPFALTIERTQVMPDATNSQLELDVIKSDAPGFAQSVAALKTCQTITVGGQQACVKTSVVPLPSQTDMQTPLPPSTLTPGTPGTVTHTQYEVPTALFLYEINTDAIAGDNSGTDLQAMIQSLVIQS